MGRTGFTACKGVDVGIFLGFVDSFPAGETPDLAATQAIDLEATIPAFEDPGIDTTIPQNATLRYVEGIAVE